MFYGGIFIEKQLLQETGIKYPIKLEYYKEINNDEMIRQREMKYGLRIIKTEYREDETRVEEKKIKHVTNDENLIDEMLYLFKENSVTPVGADDVLEDLLKQKF